MERFKLECGDTLSESSHASIVELLVEDVQEKSGTDALRQRKGVLARQKADLGEQKHVLAVQCSLLTV